MCFILLICTLLSCLTACPIVDPTTTTTTTTTTGGSPQLPEWVDYADQVKLDMNSNRLKEEVTVHQYIDGDTTHFNVSTSISDSGVLKARYLAVNTPESTGKIEEWGKKAAQYTRSKLEEAISIIIESDTTSWDLDSTGARYLVWVWYKTAEMSDYRCINLELLQEGLAVASNSAQNSYGDYCMNAIAQAKKYELYVHSKDKDPDFYYGEANPVTLNELVTNPEKYLNTKVAFEGVIVKDDSGCLYVQDYCAESDMIHGMQVYKGQLSTGLELLKVGNRVLIVGSFQYYEAGGVYQVTDLNYRPFKPNDPNNFQLISEGHDVVFAVTDPEKFANEKVTLTVIDENDEEIMKTFDYAALSMNTIIEMHNLTVTDVYTTDNGGNSDGAMTLTCYSEDGTRITVRTNKLMIDGELVTEEYFMGKTIDVRGLVASFNGQYQIKLLSLNDVVVK